MTLPFDLPPWMLWAAAGLGGCAAVSLVGGAWRARRRRPPPAPKIAFQPLPGAAAAGKAPAFAPPAPLADAAPDDGPEQRTDFRRPGNPVLLLVADADDRRPPWHAWVVDRSRHGLRLAVERPLAVGRVYTVRPAQAPAATPWTALEVRHCGPVDAHWEAGCRFLEPPPIAALMLFG
ncbi:MAG TPA: PilZ domain-containing protein [Gemmataceae bacterium]